MSGLRTALAVGALLSVSLATPAMAGQWQHKTNYAGFKDVSIYVPDSTTPRAEGKRGLVFALHGCGQVNDQFVSSGGWPEAADKYGLVVVVPEVVHPVFPNTAYPNNECYDYGYNQKRDYPVLAAAAKTIRDNAEFNIDPNQVYITGLSAGGAVAMEVACLNPDVFSGVGVAAGAAIGSNQATAVFRDWMITEKSIGELCTKHAGGKLADLRKQVYSIIADDNNIPYSDMDAYDGDKFVPIVYHPMIANAMAGIFGAQYTGEIVQVGSGRGLVGRPAERDYTATAQLWKDGEGRTRVSLITHDTLTHAWPSGPLNHALDAPCQSPDGKSLDYYKDANGKWDANKLKTAPNGAIGCLYVNENTIDYPMYLAKLWSDNNPRLGEPEPENEAPRVSVSAEGDATGISVSGSVIDVDGSVAEAGLVVTDAAGNARPSVALNLQSNGSFSHRVEGLSAGSYTVRVDAKDDKGAPGSASAFATVGSVEVNTPPQLKLLGANPMTVEHNSSFTDPGATASDKEDGDLTATIVASCSVNTAVAGTYKCSYSVTDSAGAKATAERSVIVKKAVDNTGCTAFTASLTAQQLAGRVYVGGWWWAPSYYVTGSNEKLSGVYFWSSVTVHQKAGESGFRAGPCP